MMRKENRAVFRQPLQLPFIMLNFHFMHLFYLIFKVFQDIWYFVSKYGEQDLSPIWLMKYYHKTDMDSY